MCAWSFGNFFKLDRDQIAQRIRYFFSCYVDIMLALRYVKAFLLIPLGLAISSVFLFTTVTKWKTFSADRSYRTVRGQTMKDFGLHHGRNQTAVPSTSQPNHTRVKDIIQDIGGSIRNSNASNLPLCPTASHTLGLVGRIFVNLSAPTWKELEAMHPELQPGGRWKPKHCRARSRVAIVVPYLNRDENLRIFLQHMHPFLQKQQLEYGIFLAEPIWERANRKLEFNRGLMRNIGFKEATKKGEYDCVVFHDLDLLPEVDYNSYGCPSRPRHMCVALNYHNYKPLAAGAIFGGVVSFRTEHFLQANGYSNLFFGWGGEDDDLYRRSRTSGLRITRPNATHGRYTGAPHKKDKRASGNLRMWKYGGKRWRTDGLNSLRYNVLERQPFSTYTWRLVDYSERLYGDEKEAFLKKLDRGNRKRKKGSH